MIIRHDLELVFLHVPKCAGTRLRALFRIGAEAHALEELWNYSHSAVLNRYIDQAHQPLSDLCTTASFRYLKRYRVVACLRDPYKRLPSAANEYYRQKSKRHERRVIEGLRRWNLFALGAGHLQHGLHRRGLVLAFLLGLGLMWLISPDLPTDDVWSVSQVGRIEPIQILGLITLIAAGWISWWGRVPLRPAPWHRHPASLMSLGDHIEGRPRRRTNG